jgi:hypothetical protein
MTKTILASLMLLLCVGCCGVAELSDDRMRTILVNQMPLGANRARAVRVLELHGFEHINDEPTAHVISARRLAGKCFFTHEDRDFLVDILLGKDHEVIDVVVESRTRPSP